MGENNNKKRGSKQEDKPIKIIENYNKELEKEKEKYILKNEAFQIIDYKQVTDKEQIIPHKDKNIYDTFCIGIFISGLAFPIKLTSIIENSDNFISPCGHPQCSMFPSIEPSLLNTFINENSKNLSYKKFCEALKKLSVCANDEKKKYLMDRIKIYEMKLKEEN